MSVSVEQLRVVAPDKWLAAAAAARKWIEAERERAPRVFRVGDAEPADRDTITLKGIANQFATRPEGTELTFKYGNYGTLGIGGWYQMSASHRTFDRWDAWLALYGPLVEVIQ